MNQFNSINTLTSFQKVPVVNNISKEDFYNEFVNKNKPVVLKGMADNWKALNWNGAYFKQNEGNTKLAIKTGDVSQGKREMMFLSEYVELLSQYEEQRKAGLETKNPGYLHDVPFFYLFPKFKKDIEPFPVHLFPEWYHENWHQYIQFFMGATGSLTPLHFDTLCTHNLFFQVVGQKRFILIPESQKDLCYMKSWRWAGFNPDQPDYVKYPMAKDIQPTEAIIGPGDILFMPSGTLHQVHGLSFSISFNIDWHTSESAFKGMKSFFKGAPRKNAYYNFLTFMGVACKVPPKYIFPYYKSYLNYVS